MQNDSEEVLNRLAELGAVHITRSGFEHSEETTRIRAESDEARRALSLLSSSKAGKHGSGSLLMASAKAESGEEIVRKILNIDTRIHDLYDQCAACEIEKKAVEPFGSFDPESVKKLQAKGFRIKLLSIAVKADESLPEGVTVFELSRSDGQKYLAAVSNSDFSIEGAREIPLPSRSLDDINLKIAACTAEIDAAAAEMSEIARDSAVVERYLKELEEKLMFSDARSSMMRSGKVAYLQGFCPGDSCNAILKYARENAWGILVKDPSEDDLVPTLIRNPSWIRPIKSLFDLIDVLPGYREVDASSLFLVFFSIFFAILVGDAGYGIIFLLLTLFLRHRFPLAPAEPFRLLGLLSVCTIIWGVITANVFGTGPSFLSSMKIAWLLNEKNFISFCFLMGAVHLSLAHAWNVIRSINSTRALSQLGWIGLTWSMFYAARFLVLDYPLPGWFKYMFIPALALAVIFKTPFSRLKTEWTGHIMMPFDVIGNFVDVVSYVRLFAVGGASLAVALAFNEIAMERGFSSLASGLISSVILFIGHALNIILAIMSVLVHGVRLNTLEFSGHLGLEWGGFRFKPFAREKK